MPAHITRVLQVGDIHLPQWPSHKTALDLKDPKFSYAITDDLTQDRLAMILRSFNRIATSGVIDAVILMGDFTSRGDVGEIRKAVEILDNLIAEDDNEKRPIILGVAGNHDVSLAEARALGPFGKFRHVQEAFSKFGWMAPPIEDARRYKVVSSSGLYTDTILINTSIGSMSVHNLPPYLEREFSRDELDRAAVPFFKSEDDNAVAPDYGDAKNPDNRRDQLDQLDTPYIAKTALNTLLSEIIGCEQDTVFVVAHHNILPQRIPRITPYAEMLNAGMVRDCFHQTRKNIIYLHGHIHEDPIEVIHKMTPYNQRETSGSIISISAPPIWKGFNELALFYDEHGEAFMLRVTSYRPDRNGVIGAFSEQETRYYPLFKSSNDLMSRRVRIVWDMIRDHQRLTWNEATELSRRASLSDDELENILMILFSNRLIEIKNLGKPKPRWRIGVIEMSQNA